MFPPSTPRRTNPSDLRVARGHPPPRERSLSSGLRPPACFRLAPQTPSGLWRWGPSSSFSQLFKSWHRRVEPRGPEVYPAPAGPPRIDAGSGNCWGKIPPAPLWRPSPLTPGSRPTSTWRPGEGVASGRGSRRRLGALACQWSSLPGGLSLLVEPRPLGRVGTVAVLVEQRP